jgi:agmatine deiminase
LTNETITVLPEWAPQKAIWTAWPANPEDWAGDLKGPRRDIVALVHALAGRNKVKLLVNGGEAEASARAALGNDAELVPLRYGDIWLRDTGPIFARNAAGSIALTFRFNGWGGKFDSRDDAKVGEDIAKLANVVTHAFDFVLEGGAIEQDGEGTIVTTRQTLLNANRNGWTQAEAEAALRDAFGARKIIWINQGLMHDHTDGHIDNLARFVAPGRVVCQSPSGDDDPNAEALETIAQKLQASTDAAGRKLEVIRVPSPGLVRDANGEIAPASHMNFVIANGIVVVPVYGTPSAEPALDALRPVFPGRKVIGLPSHGVLGSGDAGGGSFHCITREEPL